MTGIFRNRWWVVFACACGLLMGSGAINIFAFGVFLKPITQDLGIGRGELGSALVLNSALTALACPLLGWLIDRWGTRRVMIPGLLLCAAATASYSQLQAAPLIRIYLIFGFAGFVFCCQTPIPYATVTAQWFDRKRGIALGIAMAGVGLGVALIPQLAGFLIRSYGWRQAYIGLAVALLVIAFVPVAVFVREPPELQRKAAQRRTAAATALLPGATAAEGFRSGHFWALTIAFFLAVAAINGTLTHVVALLTDRGVPVKTAVAALSSAGLAIIFGRILSGWFLDRFWGPYVAIGFFMVPMAGIGLLASGANGFVPLLGAVLCGMGIGAEVDLMAFFVSRYFGLKAYAKIYGTMFATFSIGTGVGPWLSGQTYDSFHSYRPIFIVYEVALAITCLLFLRLGPYPYPARPKRTEGAEDEKVLA